MNAVEVVNATRTRIDEELVARLVAKVLEQEGVVGAEVGVEFVGEKRIRELNREFRARDEVTDVLSFPLEEWEPGEAATDGAGAPGEAEAVVAASLAPDLGEVAEAVLSGTAGDDLPPSFEVAVLLAHGTLHLLGYDHETDAGQMALRQAEVLELVEWEGLVVATSR